MTSTNSFDQLKSKPIFKINRYVNRTLLITQAIILILNYLNYITLPIYLLLLPFFIATCNVAIITTYYWPIIKEDAINESTYGGDIFRHLTTEEKLSNER